MFAKVYKFVAVHFIIILFLFYIVLPFSRLTVIRLFPDIYPIYFMDTVVDKKHVGSFYLYSSKSQHGVEHVLETRK